jgi:hypothetical protein
MGPDPEDLPTILKKIENGLPDEATAEPTPAPSAEPTPTAGPAAPGQPGGPPADPTKNGG